jgi:hypothetical protein
LATQNTGRAGATIAPAQLKVTDEYNVLMVETTCIVKHVDDEVNAETPRFDRTETHSELMTSPP